MQFHRVADRSHVALGSSEVLRLSQRIGKVPLGILGQRLIERCNLRLLCRSRSLDFGVVHRRFRLQHLLRVQIASSGLRRRFSLRSRGNLNRSRIVRYGLLLRVCGASKRRRSGSAGCGNGAGGFKQRLANERFR